MLDCIICVCKPHSPHFALQETLTRALNVSWNCTFPFVLAVFLFMALVWIFLCHIVSNFKGCLSYPLCCFFTLASSFPILFQTEAALSHSGRDGALSSEWRCWSAGDRHFHCNQKATTILTLNVMIQTYGFQIEMWREDEGGKKKESRHGKDRGGVNNNRFFSPVCL